MDENFCFSPSPKDPLGTLRKTMFCYGISSIVLREYYCLSGVEGLPFKREYYCLSEVEGLPFKFVF